MFPPYFFLGPVVAPPLFFILESPLAATLGPAPLGAPCYGVWAGCAFLLDTPCSRDFSRNSL